MNCTPQSVDRPDWHHTSTFLFCFILLTFMYFRIQESVQCSIIETCGKYFQVYDHTYMKTFFIHLCCFYVWTVWCVDKLHIYSQICCGPLCALGLYNARLHALYTTSHGLPESTLCEHFTSVQKIIVFKCVFCYMFHLQNSCKYSFKPWVLAVLIRKKYHH